MNVEEMITKIRELSVIHSTALMPITYEGEYLIDIEVVPPNMILKFTKPETHMYASDNSPLREETERREMDIEF